MTRRTFFGLAACATLRADTAQERGRKIMDNAVQALGGDGYRYMQTRTETGRAYSFYRDKMTGLSVARISTKYLPPDNPAPVHEVQRQAFGKKFDDAVIFSTGDAYEVTFRGAKPLPDERIKQYRESLLQDIFYILRMRLNEPGMAFESTGKDVVENQPVEVLDIFDPDNRHVTAWIHSSTLLPVKQRFERWDPVVNDRREEVTRFTKYRESGNGVMWPYDIQRERDKEKIFEMYSEKVTIGDDLANSLFELPGGITILKK
jgi:hypothetical protein